MLARDLEEDVAARRVDDSSLAVVAADREPRAVRRESDGAHRMSRATSKKTSPLVASTTAAFSSLPPTASRAPSDENARASTDPSREISKRTSPLVASTTAALLSSPSTASRAPSDENARAHTSSLREISKRTSPLVASTIQVTSPHIEVRS